MKIFYLILVIVTGVLIVLSINQKGESTSFYGIAETREIVINSDNSVEIQKIHVVQGQTIKQGDTLVELSRPELNMKINELSHQASQAKSQQSAKAGKIRSEIKELQT